MQKQARRHRGRRWTGNQDDESQQQAGYGLRNAGEMRGALHSLDTV